jgi:hypothetical protein
MVLISAFDVTIIFARTDIRLNCYSILCGRRRKNYSSESIKLRVSSSSDLITRDACEKS